MADRVELGLGPAQPPRELLDLLPAPMREMLPVVAEDPQMTSYHQNLVTVGAP